MKNRRMRGFASTQLFLAGLMFSLIAATLGAQTFRGTILGTVTDVSGAIVPDATVTIRNVDTGLVRTTVTQSDGSYRVPELPVGTYDVTVKQAFGTTLAPTEIVVLQGGFTVTP